MFKSIKTSVLVALLIGTTIIAHAQKKITEGTATYTMQGPAGKADNKVKFSGDLSMFSFQAGPATVNVITDSKNLDQGMVLVEVPIAQQMIAAKMGKEDMEKERAKVPAVSDFAATGTKEMIAGYNAEKYTYKDATGAAYELWMTTELELPVNTLTSLFKDVKGTAVKFTSSHGSVTLKSVKEEKVALSVTKAPEGYDVITYAEMMAMSGGG